MKTLAERFWPKVNKNAPGGCWEWTGKRCVGYGHIFVDGESRVTHRIALMLLGYNVPDELHVDHVCRNRACCNPDHLRLVTPRVNALENNLSPYAANARKTHCKRGHPLSGRNILVLPARGAKGQKCKQRMCVACYVMRRPNAKTLRGKPIGYYLHVLGKGVVR